MPFPNEHSCRLVNPDKVRKGSYQRLIFKHNGKKYSALVGVLKATGKKVTQALRYPKATWTTASARAHCESKDGSFEAAAGTTQTAVSDAEYMLTEFNPLIP